jgi:NAD(P)H-hydrate repair Nnr-like enzyme with NAD(P)H-hydrate dehydratase domain
VLTALGHRAVAVFDAHALDELGDLWADLLDRLAVRLVLTPNRDECRRLLPSLDDGATDQEAAAAVAARFGAVVAGHGSVATADRTWCDPDGGVGLATSGSGDVLAGLIAGLGARTGDPVRAACWGTHVHVTAGARLASRVGTVGFLARELADEVPATIAAIG